VMRQLVENGEVRRGALGVETQDVTPELASMLSIGAGKGTVVTRVRSGTPAAEAGLKPGDVITSVNGKAIGSGQDLHNIEGLTPIGTNLTVGLLRDGKALSLPMILKVSASTNRRGLDLDARLTGVQLADLSDSQRRPGVSGSAVKDIDRNSRAYASDLRTGDVIVGINQRDIEDTSDLAELLQRTPRQLLLTVVRGQSVFYLLLQ
ncbi:MAG TPA: PDZ domain-containing protein, partial [Dokdonella sp.]|nr:PDZ domain-containing protein [Dokdonella sp.]